MRKKSTRPKAEPLDARSAKILKALRDARKVAVKSARMHGVPIVYLKAGKLIHEWP